MIYIVRDFFYGHSSFNVVASACQERYIRQAYSAEAEPGRIFSILANSHSLLHNGHALLVLSHRWMQSRWKTCPQVPHAILSPGCSVSPVGFAWYSMLGSYKLFLQMAHVSVHMAHDHIATAFHFLTSNRFPPFPAFPFFSTALTCSSTCSRHEADHHLWSAEF